MCILMACSALRRLLCTSPWKKSDRKRDIILDGNQQQSGDGPVTPPNYISAQGEHVIEMIDFSVDNDMSKSVEKSGEDTPIDKNNDDMSSLNPTLLENRDSVFGMSTMKEGKDDATTSSSYEFETSNKTKTPKSELTFQSRFGSIFDLVATQSDENDDITEDEFHAQLWDKLAHAERPLKEKSAMLLWTLESIYGEMPALQVHEIQNDFKMRLARKNAVANIAI